MSSRPGGGWAVPRRLAHVGEVATMATTVGRLLLSIRAERESRLTWVVPPTLDSSDHPQTAHPPASGCTRLRTKTALPVLLVHGYLGTPASWDPLVPALHRAGFADVCTFGYNALASTIPLLAADVVRAADQAMERSGKGGIHLVGHSLGGLVIRYAVQRLGLCAAADGVVTVATPHRGSPFATVAPGVAGAQMRPGSALLHQLPPLAGTSGVRWLVVDSEQDLIVSRSLPPTTDSPTATHHPHGTGGVRYLVVRGGGHQSVLRSEHIREVVVGHLSGHPQGVPMSAGAVAA